MVYYFFIMIVIVEAFFFLNYILSKKKVDCIVNDKQNLLTVIRKEFQTIFVVEEVTKRKEKSKQHCIVIRIIDCK